jgi:hypothetical protein
VHIICIGWDIKGTADQSDVRTFGEAMKAAHDANIIILCAFSNQGNNPSDNYSPCAWQPWCWTIGEAAAMGDMCNNVDKTKVDFLFPGEQFIIGQESNSGTSVSDNKRENGASISIGLAAGTAATLLSIRQLVKPEFYEKLQQPERMKAAFKMFWTGRNSEHCEARDDFLSLFGDASENSEVENLLRQKVEMLVWYM